MRKISRRGAERTMNLERTSTELTLVRNFLLAPPDLESTCSENQGWRQFSAIVEM